jgi:acyl-CoA thioesterase FadM
MEVTLEMVVRSTGVDVDGHVNNAKYVEYPEWGREGWYERQGFDSGRLRALGAITVVVNLNLNYRQPCRQCARCGSPVTFGPEIGRGNRPRVRERWPRARWPLSELIAASGPKAGA